LRSSREHTKFIMTIQHKTDSETEESLMVLREIDANPKITQRELSSHLGLSLGKINFLMRALIEKGWIKAENFKNSKHKSAYLYCLTPQGLEEKAKTTCRFLKRKIEEYEKLEIEIRKLKKEVGFSDLPSEGRDNIL
jgi:EPS-associated MarR family transcriptional regulator